MKLQFNPNLDYQLEAIEAITDIFEGNPICQSNFTVSYTYDKTGTAGSLITNLGVGNKLDANFDEEDVLKNVREIQIKYGLEQSSNIKKNDYHFTIEMETATGKTYVYLRTIFELHKKYGFSKYIIVVPSVAIKEGVIKSIDIMTEHFNLLYDNAIFKANEYKSKNIENIREFATSDNIRIMVMTVQSFNKDSNVINKDHERTNGLKPLEFIRDTNPIVIIDEPQSSVSTAKANDAVMSLNPLCTLRYSATHKDKHNLMYKLDSIDAYERQLVKQIEVASIESKDSHNNAYLRLVSVNNKKSPITAKIEIDKRKKSGTGIERKVVTVKQGSDLFDLSGGRDLYSGYVVSEIYCEKDNEFVDFTSQDYITLGEVRGEVDDSIVKRMQIKKTIEEHLEKEKKLKSKGIKVLSLFFIDRVANYRTYDEDGNPQKGKYALWFEEEYKQAIKNPKYRTLFNDVDIDSLAESVHNGYFSTDKKGKLNDTNGNTLSDEDAYSLIMKDKEKLLSFDSKLKFIFSHSALREGWDNPNVFQICTLNETKSEMKKRQEIGRGLRIAVNQDGERIHGFDVNTLTVMANESYEDFAEKLQKEIEEEEGIKFGVIEKHSFANIIVKGGKTPEYLGEKQSQKIWSHFKDSGYIDDKGKVTDSLKTAIKENKVAIPEEYSKVDAQILRTVKKIAGNLNIKNADDKRQVKLNKMRYVSPEFKELWDNIKYKTTFSVDYNTDTLVEKCCDEIKENLRVDKAKLIYTKGLVKEINKGGIKTKEKNRLGFTVDDMGYELPDVITYLQNSTKLTRKTIVRILLECGRIADFKNNPQKFMDDVSDIIKRKMRLLIVDGVKYEKLDDEIYAQELFETEELYGYLSKNMIPSERSIYDFVLYDSDVERRFAQRFEENESVKVYAKLPDWFKIDTPLGYYNPDWAVFIDKDGVEKLYFVVETKGSMLIEDIRDKEQKKIDCGKKHFKAIGTDVKFEKHNDFDNFIENV